MNLIRLFPLFATVLLAWPASSASAQIVMSTSLRERILEDLESFLDSRDPVYAETLTSVPDPFQFGRVIPSEEPEGEDAAFRSPPETLVLLSNKVRAEILGVQAFGDRVLVATRTMGLLRPGQVLTFELPEYPGETVQVRIAEINPEELTLSYRNLQTKIALVRDDSRIQRLP